MIPNSSNIEISHGLLNEVVSSDEVLLKSPL